MWRNRDRSGVERSWSGRAGKRIGAEWFGEERNGASLTLVWTSPAHRPVPVRLAQGSGYQSIPVRVRVPETGYGLEWKGDGREKDKTGREKE